MKYRNRLYQLMGCTFLSAALLGTNASAEDKVTFVSQGGAWQDAQTVAILDPITEQYGIEIMQDSAPDAWPMIKTQGTTGQAVWDVVDTPPLNCVRGGQQGLIEEIDYAKVPNASSMPDAYKTPYSVAYEFYSSVLAYNKDNLEKVPSNWVDFWDVENFPGKRALRNHPLATLEAALLADGVAQDELYPLDVDRAFAKLEEIKPHITTWWTSGGQSAQLLFDGEVDMLMMWNGRVSAAVEAGANAGMSYDQGILQSTHLCMIKDSPNPEAAVKFLNAAISPDLQANLPLHIDYGPGNPAAFDTGKISEEIAKTLPSYPENANKQAMMSYEWWASEKGEAAERRWLEFMQQ
ncbi:ABC transporter substrate-binding protein [Marinobacterium mangrovicola]|uniref:Putative spermidine/putrescine transport system substrate-binding protein n=1 Tax=Marinobacterium mangrovicola TaxID=1476959 RepID=A0A4R1G2V8_9GAMM|nr:ABC transporter substrate-binding protein [Marinobacterium mangrovicola]TCK02277.1 putative spermidine/putrescine transport system substrate-binding protein [Marinobacterium mangrovicola]